MQPIPKVPLPREENRSGVSDQGSNAQTLTLNLPGPRAEAFLQAAVRIETCK